ncbi:hypothetical protein F0L68_00610 [Solihabitans fulvus]|uniref:Uncharacterized protein n=1 Tax=Solihabitans fulvus TaxID=1892852 RepID=A0A5B2XW46_9PSEU|nr:hypothetical protein [Solihabitans fulvus]KAA2267069.1 hypothetical protein F0L68_00610 [Solihabitans fulvus]
MGEWGWLQAASGGSRQDGLRLKYPLRPFDSSADARASLHRHLEANTATHPAFRTGVSLLRAAPPGPQTLCAGPYVWLLYELPPDSAQTEYAEQVASERVSELLTLLLPGSSPAGDGWSARGRARFGCGAALLAAVAVVGIVLLLLGIHQLDGSTPTCDGKVMGVADSCRTPRGALVQQETYDEVVARLTAGAHILVVVGAALLVVSAVVAGVAVIRSARARRTEPEDCQGF